MLTCFFLSFVLFGSGFVAEHMDLRHFLTIGMISSGLMSVLFGLGYFWKIHYFAYFVTVMVCYHCMNTQHIINPGMLVYTPLYMYFRF